MTVLRTCGVRVSQYSHLSVDLSDENSAATEVVRLVGQNRLVLDVGCAHGYLAEALRARGCRVIGVETDPEDAARARAHCEQVIVKNVEDPGWTDELRERQFEAVVCADVLEHLRDPARVLRGIRGLLDPERGFIVASVPNVDSGMPNPRHSRGGNASRLLVSVPPDQAQTPQRSALQRPGKGMELLHVPEHVPAGTFPYQSGCRGREPVQVRVPDPSAADEPGLRERLAAHPKRVASIEENAELHLELYESVLSSHRA